MFDKIELLNLRRNARKNDKCCTRCWYYCALLSIVNMAQRIEFILHMNYILVICGILYIRVCLFVCFCFCFCSITDEMNKGFTIIIPSIYSSEILHWCVPSGQTDDVNFNPITVSGQWSHVENGYQKRWTPSIDLVINIILQQKLNVINMRIDIVFRIFLLNTTLIKWIVIKTSELCRRLLRLNLGFPFLQNTLHMKKNWILWPTRIILSLGSNPKASQFCSNFKNIQYHSVCSVKCSTQTHWSDIYVRELSWIQV